MEAVIRTYLDTIPGVHFTSQLNHKAIVAAVDIFEIHVQLHNRLIVFRNDAETVPINRLTIYCFKNKYLRNLW